MSDITFVNGIRFYKPHEKAPDFVISNGEINKAELIEFLESQPDKLRFNVKESKNGNFYAAIDTYKPKDQTDGAPEEEAPKEDDLPF